MFISKNPFTNKILKSYTALTAEQINEKIAASKEAYHKWNKIPLPQRCHLIQNIAFDLTKNKIAYAEIITSEMGKLKHEAIAEVEKCAWLCEYYAKQAPDFLKDKTIETVYDQSYVSYQSIGGILGIMPWNFPFWQAFRFAIPALLVGNATLLKPAPNVPQTGLLLEEIFEKCLGRKDLFQTILADVKDIPEIIAHPFIAGVSITGSSKAGAAVASLAGNSIKKCLLELGGNDAFIVLEDANIEAAIEVGFNSRMYNCGQTCIAAKRFILHEKIADKFITGLKEKIASLSQGNPTDDGTSLTVMARPDLKESLHKQVEKSIQLGAKLEYSYDNDEDEQYFHPIILSNIKPNMPAYTEELFGPVFSIFIIQSDKEAIELTNDSIYGLGASVWSNDLERAAYIAQKLEVGAVAINDMVKSDPRMPFGGIKQSGFGRELSAEGLLEFANIKSVVVRHLNKIQ